jgi:tight adherence protein B
VRLGGALALAIAAIAPSAHAADSRLSPAGGAFPLRSYVLTLPTNSAVAPSAVKVTENGEPVQRLSVVPATSRFAVLLLIDASTSMRGEPIKGAMAAARAFAAQRPAAQPLGIVTFNATPKVLAQPTTDGSTLSQALQPRPALARGTHIYDALATGLKEIDPAKYDAAAVVLLSDGHDYGSTATPAKIAAAARAAHARLFTVGLQSSLYDPKSLESIAGLGNGEYLGAASPKALSAIYRTLGDQLANAYTIRYLSTAPSGKAVAVAATAGAATATDSYTAPRIRATGEVVDSLQDEGKPNEPFFSTNLGAALVALAVLLLVVFGLWLPWHNHNRRAALRRRVGDYGGLDMPADLDGAAEPRRPRNERMERLAESLELARMDVTPGRFILNTSLATILFAVVTSMIFGPLFLFVSLILGPLVARGIVRHNMEKQRRLFADQLADSIQAVTSSMRTGNSFVGALSRLVDDAPEPTASEFRRVIADERLGVPLDTALSRMVERMQNKDLQQVGLVTVIQRETGGNGAEALDRVVGNIRARDDIRRLVRTLTAQGRLSQAILTSLPVATALVLKVVGGNTMDPLFNTGYGHALLLVAAICCGLGGLWIGRISKVKV